MAKRTYKLEPEEFADEPEWLRDAGQVYKISGVLLQGQGETFVVMSPTANPPTHPRYLDPSLEQWCAFLARTDDPLIFERDETGTIKAVHRKVQYQISGSIQWDIFHRDNYCCLYCGQTGVQLTVDHFYPLELGGKDDRSNYLSSCRRCNKSKGAQHPRDFCTANGYDEMGLEQYLLGKAPASFIAHL